MVGFRGKATPALARGGAVPVGDRPNERVHVRRGSGRASVPRRVEYLEGERVIGDAELPAGDGIEGALGLVGRRERPGSSVHNGGASRRAGEDEAVLIIAGLGRVPHADARWRHVVSPAADAVYSRRH